MIIELFFFRASYILPFYAIVQLAMHFKILFDDEDTVFLFSLAMKSFHDSVCWRI